MKRNVYTSVMEKFVCVECIKFNNLNGSMNEWKAIRETERENLLKNATTNHHIARWVMSEGW